MDDFSTPHLINAFGIRPSPVNFIKPGKIPQSSMVPTVILDKDGNPEMCIGGSGGSRITSGVGLVAMRTLWQGKTIKQAIDEPRVHHQLQPTFLEVEEFFAEDLTVPGTFCGRPGEDWDDWLEHYKRVSKYYQWDAATQLSNAVFFLTDTVLIWYENQEDALTS
ncbi:scoloptoxin SSD20-like [Rhipicephalus sanguineus]|uniref:scoloptoxin SSD20-like n=1 Tax=Rhipicephalus sanguineus TaxID=34632 RepID=UPI001896202F|nr:scoloptoxin SSD20-like [Rhipicephalus sanguineus]